MAMSRRRQQGFTLIELLVALVVAMGLIALAADMMQRDARRNRNDNTGEWLRIVASGAKAYRSANKDALLAAAGPSSPVTVSYAQIVPYLPAGFSSTNAYGQIFEARFIEPTPGQLDGIVLTYNGDNLDGLDLVHIANVAKGGAGYINPSNTAEARGPNGNWTRSLAPFGGTVGAGKLAYALFYDDVTAINGGPSGDFLSRVSVPGQPEQNRMSTAIDMANNDVNNAGWIRAREGMFGAISIGSNTYGAPWPYETFGLPAGNNFRFNVGGTEQMAVMGDGSVTARYQFSAPNLTAANTITGTTVNASYVNAWDVRANGGVYSNNSVNASWFDGNEYYANGWFRSRGNSGWYSETYGGGWHMTDSTWIRAYNGKNIYSSGEVRGGRVTSESDIQANGNISANGAVSAGGRLTGNDVMVNGVAGEGGGCGPSGLIARAGDGSPLNCVNGVWKRPGGITEVVSVYGASGSQGNYWTYAYCPPGYTITGGGFVTAYMQKASSPEGPQEHRPLPEINAYGVRSGAGANVETRVHPYATCAR